MKICPTCETPYPDDFTNCPSDGTVLIKSLDLEFGHFVRGKYRIVRKLGRGGIGEVYLAEHFPHGAELALKFLNAELSKNPEFVERFRNEARAAYQLRHPNIAEVADADQDEYGRLFIAMEYVPGISLRRILRESWPHVTVDKALQIVRGVAAGLAAVRAHGAVHRDIKPENILLGVDLTGEIQPKLVDFGIAAMTKNIKGLRGNYGPLLAPQYAAPEQWKGAPSTNLDDRIDAYALGGVLYEMLAGRTPFQAANPRDWMSQHLHATPEPLSSIRPDIVWKYPGLDDFVMRLLDRDPKRRFPLAAAVEAIDNLLAPANAAIVRKLINPEIPPGDYGDILQWVGHGISKNEPETSVPPLEPQHEVAQERHINATIVDGEPPLEIGKTYKFEINIGKLCEHAIEAPKLHEFDWKESKELDVLIVLSGHRILVEPRQQKFTLPKQGDTKPVSFDITPTGHDSALLRISLYFARELTLLQEFEVSLAVEESMQVA